MSRPRLPAYLEASTHDGKRHRFWSAAVQGRRAVFRWGRIGRAGGELVIDFPSKAKARAEALQRLAGKERRGYVRATPGATAPLKVPLPGCKKTLPLFSAPAVTPAPRLCPRCVVEPLPPDELACSKCRWFDGDLPAGAAGKKGPP